MYPGSDCNGDEGVTLDLSSHVALVTGSSRGIGQAVARRLARHGAAVVVNARSNISLAEAVAEEIRAQGGRSLAVAADVSQAAAVARMVETAATTFGKVDILVNNAGITRDQLLIRMSDADWQEVIDTHLKGAFLCSKAVLRHMVKQRWGRIISISSVAGLTGNAGQANYASAKAGLIGLTRTIAKEMASRSITANVVAPGIIDTDMTRALPDRQRQALLAQIPLGRPGLPEEVAYVVACLASEEAGYITGQVVNVDGGMVMA